MGRPKMQYPNSDEGFSDFFAKLTGKHSVVYLTYDRLNAENITHDDYYDIKVKCYNNGVRKLFYYKNKRQKPTSNPYQKVRRKNSTFDEKKAEEERRKKSYIFEVRNLIKDYILSNDFDMFWTLTFDPKKCNEAVSDEYRYIEMNKWLHRMRAKHNYIAIPERHKSGQIHWHMVTGNLKPNLLDSGKKYKDNKIYNCTDWNHGFSNVQKMRSKSKVSNYVTKYITKDLLDSPVRKGKRKYWCSKGLALPEVYATTYNDICSIFPLCDENGEYNPDHTNDVCDIWIVGAK